MELTEHELDHVFIGISDELPVINTHEIMEWLAVSYNDLENELDKNPSHFTAWFRQVHQRFDFCIINMYYEKIFQKHQTS